MFSRRQFYIHIFTVCYVTFGRYSTDFPHLLAHHRPTPINCTSLSSSFLWRHVRTHWQLLAPIGRKDMDLDDPCTEILAATPTVSSLWTVPVSKHSLAISLTELRNAVLKLRKTSPGWHSNTSVLDAVSLSLARKLRLILLGAAGQYISQVTDSVSNMGSQRLTGDCF
eukprot:s6329_g2.t1